MNPIVGELIRNNPGTISLGQGIVYYDPPPEAIAFLAKFLADPDNHKYKAEILAFLQQADAVLDTTVEPIPSVSRDSDLPLLDLCRFELKVFRYLGVKPFLPEFLSKSR